MVMLEQQLAQSSHTYREIPRLNIQNVMQMAIRAASESKAQDDSNNKYEQIVNKLLKENTRLLEDVETLKMENRKLLLQNKQNNKSQIVEHTFAFQSKRSISSVVQMQSRTEGDSFHEEPSRVSIGSKNRLKFCQAGVERSRENT